MFGADSVRYCTTLAAEATEITPNKKVAAEDGNSMILPEQKQKKIQVNAGRRPQKKKDSSIWRRMLDHTPGDSSKKGTKLFMGRLFGENMLRSLLNQPR
jgi:hypothetical protein